MQSAVIEGEAKWMADQDVEACINCTTEFSMFRRRHHCRACGGIFCNDCSKHRVQLDKRGHSRPVRVCDLCVDVANDPAAAEAARKQVGAVRHDFGEAMTPEQYQPNVEAGLAYLQGLHDGFDVNDAARHPEGWRMVGSKGDTVKWFVKPPTEPDAPASVMVRAKMQCSTRQLYDLYIDNDLQKKIEPNIDFIEDVQRVDDHNVIIYMVMKSIMFTAPRDFLYVHHWEVNPDTGALYIVEFSVEHENAPEGVKGRIRATQDKGGCIAEPLQGDQFGCYVTCAINVDPKLGTDGLPSWVAKKLDDMNAQMLSNLLVQLNKAGLKNGRQAYASQPLLVNHNGKVIGDVQPASQQTANPFDGPAAPGKLVMSSLSFRDWDLSSYLVLAIALGILAYFLEEIASDVVLAIAS